MRGRRARGLGRRNRPIEGHVALTVQAPLRALWPAPAHRLVMTPCALAGDGKGGGDVAEVAHQRDRLVGPGRHAEGREAGESMYKRRETGEVRWAGLDDSGQGVGRTLEDAGPHVRRHVAEDSNKSTILYSL